MRYLVQQDLSTLIQDSNLNQIINNDSTILDAAVEIGIAEARSYLIQKYKFDEEIGLTASSRDTQMVQTITDITLYHIHSRIAPRNIPDLRIKRYDVAIGWLKACAYGDVTPGITEKDTVGKMIRWGSVPKNNNNY
jgi:phage gp36-like protein